MNRLPLCEHKKVTNRFGRTEHREEHEKAWVTYTLLHVKCLQCRETFARITNVRTGEK